MNHVGVRNNRKIGTNKLLKDIKCEIVQIEIPLLIQIQLYYVAEFCYKLEKSTNKTSKTWEHGSTPSLSEYCQVDRNLEADGPSESWDNTMKGFIGNKQHLQLHP